ncbi:MAG: iron-sulfur cluster assembly accessory protein [Candidatus Fonsibacter sp.]|jgi:iron-sulfur cluster insertion protein|nr:iron-sulfur cluster assembly accessory protein [Candidatus Fonsibacter sp.]
MTNNFTITDKAKKKIENLLEKESINKFFRIEVKGGGCSGYKYHFSTDNKINEDDIIYENVLIDKSSFVFVEGSMLDFSEKLIENTFKIINPKATSSCGCGSSFSV